eukprot:scaffold1612_cov137-Isochrysis_galbana.AAC.6
MESVMGSAGDRVVTRRHQGRQPSPQLAACAPWSDQASKEEGQPYAESAGGRRRPVRPGDGHQGPQGAAQDARYAVQGV